MYPQQRKSKKLPRPCEIWNRINNSSYWSGSLRGIVIFTWLLDRCWSSTSEPLSEIKSSLDSHDQHVGLSLLPQVCECKTGTNTPEKITPPDSIKRDPILPWIFEEGNFLSSPRETVPMSGYILASTNPKLGRWKHSRSEVSRFYISHMLSNS